MNANVNEQCVMEPKMCLTAIAYPIGSPIWIEKENSGKGTVKCVTEKVYILFKGKDLQPHYCFIYAIIYR